MEPPTSEPAPAMDAKVEIVESVEIVEVGSKRSADAMSSSYDQLIAAAGASRPESWKKNVWTPEEDAQLTALMGTVVDQGGTSGKRPAQRDNFFAAPSPPPTPRASSPPHSCCPLLVV